MAVWGDQVESIVFALGFVILGVFIRLLPVRYATDSFGRDADYHVFLVREYAENEHTLPRRAARVLGGRSDHDYPSFYHWLLSYLPKYYLPLVGRYSAFMFDAGLGSLVAVLLVDRAGLDIAHAVVLTVLFILLPSHTLVSSGPRSYSLTPRSFAQFLLGAALVIVCIAPELSASIRVFALAICSILIAITQISSKFSVQYLWFVYSAALLISPSIDSLLVAITALGMSAAIWRDGFLRQLKGQLLHLEWYYHYGQDRLTHRGNWSRLIAALKRGQRGVILEEVFFRNPILAGLVRHQPIFWTIGFGLSGGSWNFGLALLIASVAVWLATSFGALRIFGQAERYLEFSIAPAWLLFWSQVSPGEMALAITISGAYCLLFAALNLRFIRQRDRRARDELLSIGKIVDSKPSSVVLCLHYGDMTFFLAETNARVVGMNGNFSIREGHEEFIVTFFGPFPHVSSVEFHNICGRYGVDFILRRNFLGAVQTNYELADWVCCFNGNGYSLYTR